VAGKGAVIQVTFRRDRSVPKATRLNRTLKSIVTLLGDCGHGVAGTVGRESTKQRG
jgi:hypothetical protein